MGASRAQSTLGEGAQLRRKNSSNSSLQKCRKKNVFVTNSPQHREEFSTFVQPHPAATSTPDTEHNSAPFYPAFTILKTAQLRDP